MNAQETRQAAIKLWTLIKEYYIESLVVIVIVVVIGLIINA